MTTTEGRVRLYCDHCGVPATFRRLEQPRWLQCERCGRPRIIRGAIGSYGPIPMTTWIEMSLPPADGIDAPEEVTA